MKRTLVAALALLVAGPSLATEADPGEALFQSQCARCHAKGPKSLKTAPEAVAEILRKVPPHSLVKLDEAQMAALTAYLQRVCR